MSQAIALARRAVGSVSPNPPVGAVVVKDGVVVGEGFTQPPGGPHAEIVALEQAGARARGAELYVTLEPCAHQGRTPPCTAAIIEAGIARVHIALMDPAPHTDGAGMNALRAAGIEVDLSGAPGEARTLIEAFAKHSETGMPFVTAKFAMSLDGKIAARTGDARWISNEASRRRAHAMRAEADAILVGIGTVLADNPRLTVRDAPLPGGKQPLRVVVDSAGRTPPDAALLSEPGDTLLAVAGAAPGIAKALGGRAEVVALPGADGRVDLTGLLRLLGERGIASVLVEAGSKVMGGLFDAQLVDKVVAFVAPVIIGGEGAPGPVAGLGVGAVSDALRLRDVLFEEIDGDIMVAGYARTKDGE